MNAAKGNAFAAFLFSKDPAISVRSPDKRYCSCPFNMPDRFYNRLPRTVPIKAGAWTARN